MVSVQLRNAGQGTWTPLFLPTSEQAAQTLASAVRTLNLADNVRVVPAGAGRTVNIKV